MSNEVIQTDTVVAKFDDIREQLKTAATESAGMKFEIATTQGMKDAKSHIHKLRGINGDIDRAHKAVKADITKRGREIDAAKKELKGMVSEMIRIHADPIQLIEDEVAQLEYDIHSRFDVLEGHTIPAGTSAELVNQITELDEIEITKELYDGMYQHATEMKCKGLVNLREALKVADKAAADAEELTKLRAQQASREAEDKLKADLALQVQRDKERKELEERRAQEAELKKQQDELDRQKKELAETESANLRRAEAEKEADRKKQELLDKIAAHKQNVDKCRGEAAADMNNLLVDCHVYTDDVVGRDIISAIESGEIRHVAIQNYVVD